MLILKALYELVKCNYNVQDALERYRRSGKTLKGRLKVDLDPDCVLRVCGILHFHLLPL